VGIFELVLIVAAFLCTLVAGFLFAFAIVAMPGIKNLRAAEFIRAFQVMDRIIQNNQPLFMVMWIGSALSLVVAAVLGFGQLDQLGRVLVISAALCYLAGVQVPTVTINIPLNNQLQRVDVAKVDGQVAERARAAFEGRWVRWNAFRTTVACVVSGLLLVQLYRM